MIKKYYITHYQKSRIISQLQYLIDQKIIQFEKTEKKNIQIVTIDEGKIDSYELHYIYKTLISKNREVK